MFTAVSGDLELADIMKAIITGPMLHLDKQRAMAEVSSRVGGDTGSSTSAAAKAPLQTHMHIYNYMNTTDWLYLERSGLNFTNKLSYIASRCLAMGLHHPTERSVSCIVGVVVGIAQDCTKMRWWQTGCRIF